MVVGKKMSNVKTHYSEHLGMEFKTRNTAKGMRVKTADGVIYSEEEVAFILKNHMNITKEIHAIKKQFEGTIINAETIKTKI